MASARKTKPVSLYRAGESSWAASCRLISTVASRRRPTWSDGGTLPTRFASSEAYAVRARSATLRSFNVRTAGGYSITRFRPSSGSRSQEKVMEGTYSKPLPEIDDINRPFWEATRRGELRLQRCKDCREVWYRRNELSEMPVDQLRMGPDERPGRGVVVHFVSSLLASRVREGNPI